MEDKKQFELDSLKFYDSLGSASYSAEINSLTVPNNLIIYGPNNSEMVNINLKTGKIKYGEHYTPDKAAQCFWNALSACTPANTKNTVDTRIPTSFRFTPEGQIFFDTDANATYIFNGNKFHPITHTNSTTTSYEDSYKRAMKILGE